ncbi:cation diffusion facilitator family transporter [Bacillus atrophaeus]|uniref:cation diffusion facilitator family transporter n=1 Tax=Bacillus atrophaeus TaxID=1452 RepID=UPI00227E3C77|nr:cation diffusion facilitator family transporter [Bacillus atrophaeus]MCY8519556.1 cation diffusion facilitator family transporter [Bacillus atrophaeus]MCY9111910.1 cation diffusion facilitator family transporter [Bacillus atrophaeus]
MDRTDNLKRGEKGAIINIAAYITLAVIKLIIGTLYHSEALRADGLNNGTDIVASLAVLIGLRISRRPADSDHPYGHYRAETISSLIASFIMMAVGIEVLIGGGKSIVSGTTETPSMVAAWTALGGAAVMYSMYMYNKRLAASIKSQALLAAAKDSRSDAFVSAGAFVGVISAQLHLPWIDPVTAFIIGIIICKTAWDIFKEASHSLTDGFYLKDLEPYKLTVSKVKTVNRLKDVKARYLGSAVHIEMVITVDPKLSVEEGHNVADEVENAIKNEHDVTHVHVHVEPDDIK